MTRVIIVHGSYGTPAGNWFPWLKLQIENLGHEAIVPKFPTPAGQNLCAWQKVFRSQVGMIDERSILVGHSLGAGFILNLLEDYEVVPAKATFLIAGFIGRLGLPDYDGINATFVCKDFNWQLIKQRAGTIFVVNGDNDPYVPLARGQAIADALSVSLLVIPGGGHLNAESGYTSFPLLLNKICPLLASDASTST